MDTTHTRTIEIRKGDTIVTCAVNIEVCDRIGIPTLLYGHK